MPKTASAADIYIGQRLRQLRHKKGWSQRILAEQLGISYQQIQKYEAGINRLSAVQLFVLAKVFSISSELFCPIKKLPHTTKRLNTQKRT